MTIIREKRHELGLTQRKLGELCGYKGAKAQVYVARWEGNIKRVPWKKLLKVAKALGITVDEILEEESECSRD